MQCLVIFLLYIHFERNDTSSKKIFSIFSISTTSLLSKNSHNFIDEKNHIKINLRFKNFFFLFRFLFSRREGAWAKISFVTFLSTFRVSAF